MKAPLLTMEDVRALPTVQGDGPLDSRVWLVGEAPAREEMRTGMAFTGPSGEILWQWVWKYLMLQRGEVRVENLFPFQLPDKKGKEVEELLNAEVIQEYAQQLADRVVAAQPEYVITLGRWSTRALLGDVDMEWAHGIGYEWPWGVVIPVYHPAAGLHSPDRLQYTALDLQAARKVIDGEVAPRQHIYCPDKTAIGSGIVLGIAPYEIAMDTEGTIARPHSLQISVIEGLAFIIRADEKEKLHQLCVWLAHYKPLIILHHAPHDLQVLRAMGIDLIALGCRIYDTMSASHVLQTEPRGLKPLVKRVLGVDMQDYDDVVGVEWERGIKSWLLDAAAHDWGEPKGRCKPIPSRIATLASKTGEKFREAWSAWDLRAKVVGTVGPPPPIQYDKVKGFEYYACRDADVTLRAKRVLQQKIEEQGLERVLELDLAVLPFLDRIKQNGLWCDLDKLTEFHSDVQQRRVHAIEVIRALVDDEKFNPGSADQVEARLKPYLTKLALEGRCKLTKTKKRYQVDQGVLEQLHDEDPLVPAVLEYRELDKLDGSYLSPLYGMLQWRDWRGTSGYWMPLELHHASVVSGRLAGRILTWPARTEDGLKLRECFYAPEGWMLGGWDLSQIEMRLAAGLSGDKRMLKAFEDGVDLHVRTAAALFGVEESKVDKFTQRTPTKTVSYLILYGGTEDKMFTELKVMGVPGFDRVKCRQTIADWCALYPGVVEFMQQSGHEARVRGYVENFLGRRRYLPAASLLGNRWPCAKLREEAVRQAGNFKIQSGAQDLLKRAEVRVMEEVLPAVREVFEPCLQMHDEIVGLVREEHWELIDMLMVEAMTADEGVAGVRLECEGKMAKTWSQLK